MNNLLEIYALLTDDQAAIEAYVAAREADPERRQRLYDEAQRILCEEDVPIVPLFVSSLNLAVSPRVKNFEPNAMDILFLEEVWVE